MYKSCCKSNHKVLLNLSKMKQMSKMQYIERYFLLLCPWFNYMLAIIPVFQKLGPLCFHSVLQPNISFLDSITLTQIKLQLFCPLKVNLTHAASLSLPLSPIRHTAKRLPIIYKLHWKLGFAICIIICQETTSTCKCRFRSRLLVSLDTPIKIITYKNKNVTMNFTV